MLASLVGFLGDFDLAEEAAAGGVRDRGRALAARRACRPTRAAWLVTTARNRAIDRMRRERTLAEKIRAAAAYREADHGRASRTP